jgi:hypothetical protein
MRAEDPALLAKNVNTWLGKNGDERRMVRTLDKQVRAFMSPKYRPLDNFDLAQTVLPVLIENKVTITSCELTETRMFIKGILETLSDELPRASATAPPSHDQAGRPRAPRRGHHHQQQRHRQRHAQDRAGGLHDLVHEPRDHAAGSDEEIPRRPRA